MTGIQQNTEHDARRAHLMKIEDRGNTNNYHYWASCTMDKLEQLDLWKFISGPEATPPVIPTLVKPHVFRVTAAADGAEIIARAPGNEAAVKEARDKAEPWRIGDLSARALLKEAIPAHRAPVIARCVTARDIWLALREEYAPTNEIRAATLHQSLISYVCAPE